MNRKTIGCLLLVAVSFAAMSAFAMQPVDTCTIQVNPSKIWNDNMYNYEFHYYAQLNSGKIYINVGDYMCYMQPGKQKTDCSKTPQQLVIPENCADINRLSVEVTRWHDRLKNPPKRQLSAPRQPVSQVADPYLPVPRAHLNAKLGSGVFQYSTSCKVLPAGQFVQNQELLLGDAKNPDSKGDFNYSLNNDQGVGMPMKACKIIPNPTA